jgi:hypothetical protein
VTPAASSQQLLAALSDAQLSLITLPRRADCPAQLVDAVTSFHAGDRPPAITTAEWLREAALDEYGSARTYLWVAQRRVHGFFAMTVGAARVEQTVLVELEAGRRPLPSVLLAQAARWPDGTLLPAGAILDGAIGVAERIRLYAGVAALVLDPADPETGAMWQRRGFTPVLDNPPRGRERRLWRALGT